jgi:hypothetical protein
VECTPTQARAAGEKPPPALSKIEDGPGKGQYLLPVTNTQQTVDIDLIGDVMRQPERERLSLILNELGTGLAGRGRDLNEVIRRADPALQQTDRVLRILARQNRVLNELAVNSDTVLPLARERDTSPTRSAAPARWPRRRPRSAAPSRPTSRPCRASWTSSSRRWSNSARWRPDHAGADRPARAAPRSTA